MRWRSLSPRSWRDRSRGRCSICSGSRAQAIPCSSGSWSATASSPARSVGSAGCGGGRGRSNRESGCRISWRCGWGAWTRMNVPRSSWWRLASRWRATVPVPSASPLCWPASKNADWWCRRGRRRPRSVFRTRCSARSFRRECRRRGPMRFASAWRTRWRRPAGVSRPTSSGSCCGGAAPVAERLARAALEFGPDLEAGYLLGEALSDQGQVDEALAVWEAIEDLPGPDRVRAALAIAHASALNYRLGCRADAERVLARAAGRIQDGSAARLIDGALALFGATDRLVWDADADALPAVEPSVALAAALELTASGRFEAATRTVDAAIATREIWGEEFPSVELFLQLVRAWSRLLGGHVREVEAEAEVRYAAAVRERADYPRARWCLMRGLVGVIQGSPRHAISALHEGVAVTGADDRGWLRPMHVLLAMAAALAGDITAAEDSERRADEANRSIDGLFGVDAARSRAWVLAVRGELTAAADQARQAGELAVAHEQWAFEALALHDLARFGQAKEAAGRLEELAGVVDGSLVDALAAHARALAGDDGAALDAVSATFGSLGLDLFAAEASAAAARAHQREGRKASAYASRGRAREFAAGCEGAQTPALAWLERPSDLTAREREVAELAASGLTSRVIGGRLGITTPTVDNLPGRVYVKFEISGRRELVKLAGR